MVPALLGIEAIARAHGCAVERERPLREFTSLAVGGPAEWLISPQRAAAVPDLLRDLRAAGVEVRILGNGSNLLIADAGVRGAVVRLSRLPLEFEARGDLVSASASWAMPALARACAEKGLSGLEWAEGVPGTLGGALVMNAGAYGHEIAETAVSARVVRRSGEVEDVPLRPSDFGYRASPLDPEEPVLRGELRLAREARETILEKMRGFRDRRSCSQPVRERSAGCIFKNPPGDSAGRLVERAGMKGARSGGARVSEAHGNFFVNEGGATAADFAALIERVREAVRRETGTVLEEEVRRWGF
jgi:UDP-N-acetylmuramate dehydrogenase